MKSRCSGLLDINTMTLGRITAPFELYVEDSNYVCKSNSMWGRFEVIGPDKNEITKQVWYNIKHSIDGE